MGEERADAVLAYDVWKVEGGVGEKYAEDTIVIYWEKPKNMNAIYKKFKTKEDMDIRVIDNHQP
jgi:hypothetical protein